jgi:AraC-like DNA-binding protein
MTRPSSRISTKALRSARAPFRKVYKPQLCVVAQGAKRIELADRTIDYAAGQALAVSVELPGFGCITQASQAEPFLGMTLGFDTGALREVLEKLDNPPRPTSDRLAAFVEDLSAPLLDCLARLVRPFATPGAAPVLHPAIIQELYYWLLTGPNGAEISKIVRAESHARRIADAIFVLRREYKRQIRVEELAEAARMSPSSFHQHFKILTTLTPVQYQTQLRLIEARRLTVTEAANVTAAALHVGYESPSQFSREYARHVGAAPKKDAMMLRAVASRIVL